MNRNNKETRLRQAADQMFSFTKSTATKVGTGLTALAASGLAAAQGTPGASIASELAGGKADVMLIIGAVAVILGALIVWGYVKRAR